MVRLYIGVYEKTEKSHGRIPQNPPGNREKRITGVYPVRVEPQPALSWIGAGP